MHMHALPGTFSSHLHPSIFCIFSESVYDLLPKELQLPVASADSHTMSQKSGGEAGPLPPAAVASGRLRSLLPLLRLTSYSACKAKRCPVIPAASYSSSSRMNR